MTLDEHNLLHGKPWALNKMKTRCRRGHLLSGANLANYTPGQRGCKKCNSIRAAERRARIKEGNK